MDNKLIRFYNQNRMLFWTVILTIVAIIALIHILNNFAAAKKIKQTDTKTITYNKNADQNYAVISEKKINSETSNIINYFIQYCNNGKIEEAYALLSNDCKEILYPTIEQFTNRYYNKMFNTKKLFRAQAMVANNNWYTYQINFTEDILATGKIPDSSIIDYYTIINDNRRI